MIQITKTNEQKSNGIKMVIYGDAGVGKTRLAITCDNPIILSSENGLLSLADENLPFIRTESFKEIQDAYSFLATSDESKQYETVFIDSLSEISEVLLSHYLKTCITVNDKVNAQKAYGEMAISAIAMVKSFRDLKNLNVVFTCKRKYNVDKEGFRLSSEPGMPGRLLPYNVPYLVDELFCMMVNVKGQRLLQTAADPKTPAKDRSGRLNKIEKPDLNFIFNKIKGV